MPRLPRSQALKTPDDQLAHHLERAEDHLISAVNLFSNPKLKRTNGYFKRLSTAQETVTSLHTEELVRIRGPLRPPRRKKSKIK